MFNYLVLLWQKVGDENQLYNRKLRETPKAYSTAALMIKNQSAADEVMLVGW